MIAQFQYKGFQADDHLTAEAEEVLGRLQDLTPHGSTLVARLEYDGSHYSCTVDVFLRRSSFYASIVDLNPFQALHRAEVTLVERLKKCKETQFFTRNPPGLTKQKLNTFETVG